MLKQAAEKRRQQHLSKEVKKPRDGGFGVFILALTQTNADIHKETMLYRFFFSVHSQVQNVSENLDKHV